MTLQLHGLGHFHSETEITNQFLEDLDIGTTDQWILERVGIRSRRTMLPLDYIRETRNKDTRAALEAADYSNAEVGKRAALLALERAPPSLHPTSPARIGWRTPSKPGLCGLTATTAVRHRFRSAA